MPKRIRVTINCVCCGMPGPKAGRGLTARCHSRWHKRGELGRFASHREKFSPAEYAAKMLAKHGPDDCWLWPESRVNSNGYGPHRKIYEAMVAPVDSLLELDHTCRVRRCVNYRHLEVVTSQVNLYRGETLVKRNLDATHCPQRHPYDLVNTYWRPDGKGRDCKTCRRTRTAAKNAAKRDGVPYVDPYSLLVDLRDAA